MINRKDVIRVKVPFPDISADLAKQAHMYICRVAEGNTMRFIKCQTNKVTLQEKVRHYVVENSDPSRNPFRHQTLIDCDKEFESYGLIYDDALKTGLRPDVCEDLMENVERELFSDGYEIHGVNEPEMLALNKLVTRIPDNWI